MEFEELTPHYQAEYLSNDYVRITQRLNKWMWRSLGISHGAFNTPLEAYQDWAQHTAEQVQRIYFILMVKS